MIRRLAGRLGSPIFILIIVLWVVCAPCFAQADDSQPVVAVRDAARQASTQLRHLYGVASHALHMVKLRKHGLVDIRLSIPDAVIDMKYASADNFTGQVIYPADQCLISTSTGQKLAVAAGQLRQLGYRLKIFDAYRPASCQQALYDAAPDKKYVANPNGKGSNHSRAAAIDMTICDTEGNEIAMPSGFDDLSPRAWRGQDDLPADVEGNLRMVEDIMINSGFKPLPHEWWHYDDTNAKNMPLLDISLEYF